jgi:beta-lactamase superfamily II metal-dependent hydrolase
MLRKIVSGLLCLSVCSVSAQTGQSLPAWQEGFMDIHHISTGRGNAAFFIFPDSTTLLIDAGDISDTHPRTLSPRNSQRKPDASRSAGNWIADYITQFMPGNRKPSLDFAMLTHYHDDHFGEWDPNRPLASNGAYRLTGITEVGDKIPIATLIDRGRDFPINLNSPEFLLKEQKDEYHIVQTLQEYWKFIEYQSKHNKLVHQEFLPGGRDQISLKKSPESYPEWTTRNIAVNGRIWTGYADNDFTSLFKEGQYPGENPLSTCLKISYGRFDYFTGGDIAGINAWGEGDANSLEANVAPVIGPVDVAMFNHHGNRDSQSPVYVRNLRPRVWVQQSWSSDHPGDDVLRRVTSESLYPGERDVFTTDMLEANRLVIGDRVDQQYQSQHGHIVIRVYNRGAQYRVYILNDLSAKREIKAVFGPYNSR